MEEVVPKIAHRRGSNAGQARKDEKDPGEGVRGRCKKYSPVLSCIDNRRIKGSCDYGSEGEKDQFKIEQSRRVSMLQLFQGIIISRQINKVMRRNNHAAQPNKAIKTT